MAVVILRTPQQLFVERSVSIGRNIGDTFTYLVNLANQRQINYYNLAYDNLKFETDTDAGKVGKSARWHMPENNLRATLTWQQVKAPVEASFSLLVEYGIDIPLQGHCNFASSSRDITQVRCTLTGNLRLYQTAALPAFKSQDNEADPLENTLLNLKLALEAQP